ncbi:AAA family ATPase [Streptomyces sp. NPDC051976]|uniref:helix-turn-helix transcriptional regulator n=1 Tax=Streptomyces sp. NPDC051976 TaxID=3154947 RepID=UPI00341B5F79
MADAASGLFERGEECAAIGESVADVGHGAGGLLLVEGPAGIGKTRLLAEVRAKASEAGLALGRARASEMERDFAFGVVQQLFEPLLAAADPAALEELWQGPAAQARDVFTPTGTSGSAAGPAGDFAVLHGLYWLTANASQSHRLVLVVDDLQWCDAPSLRYLAYLQPRIADLGLLVATALRSGEPATDERLLQQFTTAPETRVLRPHPLTAQATTRLLEAALPAGVDPAFALACHRASGGNPLLLRELARTLIAEEMAADAGNAARVTDLGPRAVTRLVETRLARLPGTAVTLARAVAILGDRADLTAAAALAGQDTAVALRGIAALERLEILRVRHDQARTLLSFVHPLVRAAVHDGIGYAYLVRAHHRAAHLLTTAGADPERIAAHLLHTPPAADPGTVGTLRAAAVSSTRRGAPGNAYTYLRRALAEPPPGDQRREVLVEAGQTAFLVDLKLAAEHLQEALDQTVDPLQRADLALQLGTAYLWLLDLHRGVVVWTDALERLDDAQVDRRRRIEAALLDGALVAPGQDDVTRLLPGLRALPPHDSVGGRLLDCALASFDMVVCDPAGVARARRALAGGDLVREASLEGALPAGWMALLTADDETTVMDSLDSAVRHERLRGTAGIVPYYAFRALGWLWRGQLAEAESDARESRQLAAIARIEVNRLFADVYLADSLMEQGRLDEAEEVLRSIGVSAASRPPGPAYFALDSYARLLRLRRQDAAALRAARAAGRVWDAFGFVNPAMAAWRTEAALALDALGQTDEARRVAAEELELARRWGAPRALGRALRVSGLVAGGEAGLPLFQEAAAVLEDSPARLEYAKALTVLGAALRRTGQRAKSRPLLREALDLAACCGAAPLADRARTELAAAGGRPGRGAATGAEALTPSERRVAELAAGGATNRQVAQRLYITPKTVEVHLSSVYRKLGIPNRTQLADALTPSCLEPSS